MGLDLMIEIPRQHLAIVDRLSRGGIMRAPVDTGC